MTSFLCICDLDGQERLVLTADQHIEAPNWHPEGALIVNGGGRLFRVPLDAPALLPVDTGRHDGLNNDHGISADGAWLAISDKTETGKSCIHIRPWAGGAFRRVTANVPSWFHGWSPDGATLVYAAARGGPVGIWACPVAGGAEWCVTADFDHADGPDFSADGAWIWFNGEREGSVDLWRIRPDGTDLQRMTDDTAVNWFPHPSPDGAHVVYLAYPAGTTGHPGGLHVELRVMPQAGGASRPLVRLFGGQGTINVPSWSPDGRSFAYVRYDAPPGA